MGDTCVVLYRYQVHAGFLVKIRKGTEEVKIRNKSSNIEDFITYIQSIDPSVCGAICPGHPFQDIFSAEPRKKSQYEEASDEDEDGGAGAGDQPSDSGGDDD